MSYDTECRGGDALDDVARPEAVLFHDGNARLSLERHRANAEFFLRRGVQGARDRAASL